MVKTETGGSTQGYTRAERMVGRDDAFAQSVVRD
jgi:hypothetical protein